MLTQIELGQGYTYTAGQEGPVDFIRVVIGA